MRHLVGQDRTEPIPYGGIEDLERLFGISDSPTPLPPDVVLVSIDLEASGRPKGLRSGTKGCIPYIREIGIASLDTRSIFSPSSEHKVFRKKPGEDVENGMSSPPIIKTRQFSTSHASEDFQDCDVTDFRECVFARTCYVERDVGRTFTSCLEFQDHDESSASLRSVVLIGHSPHFDLDILQQHGVEIGRTAPVVMILDTHRLSLQILGPRSPLVTQGIYPALERHALSDFLTELGCAYDRRELHNAGNDATYTLHALVRLAIRWAEGKEELTPGQSARVERLRGFMEAESVAPRWKPARRALGAHIRVADLIGDRTAGPVRLGSGLKCREI